MYTIYDLPPVITWTSAAVSAGVCVTAYVWGETTAPFLEVERRRAIPQPPGSSCHRSTTSSSSCMASARLAGSSCRWPNHGASVCRKRGSLPQTLPCITGAATGGFRGRQSP